MNFAVVAARLLASLTRVSASCANALTLSDALIDASIERRSVALIASAVSAWRVVSTVTFSISRCAFVQDVVVMLSVESTSPMQAWAARESSVLVAKDCVVAAVSSSTPLMVVSI